MKKASPFLGFRTSFFHNFEEPCERSIPHEKKKGSSVYEFGFLSDAVFAWLQRNADADAAAHACRNGAAAGQFVRQYGLYQ